MRRVLAWLAWQRAYDIRASAMPIQYPESRTEHHSAKVSRVLATKGIHEELVMGREATAMINAVVSKLLVGNNTLLAGWRGEAHFGQGRRHTCGGGEHGACCAEVDAGGAGLDGWPAGRLNR